MCGSWEKNTSRKITGRKDKAMCGPLIDWNGNGRIDPPDIAIALVIAEEEAMSNEDDEEKE